MQGDLRAVTNSGSSRQQRTSDVSRFKLKQFLELDHLDGRETHLNELQGATLFRGVVGFYEGVSVEIIFTILVVSMLYGLSPPS